MNTSTKILKVILHLAILGCISGLKCVKKTPCSCEMSDGSGTVDLSGIGGGTDAVWGRSSSSFIFGRYELLQYDYNPCRTFLPPVTACPRKQMYLYNYNLVKNQGHVVTDSCLVLGTPNNVEFMYNEAGDYTTIQYKEGGITTLIDLRCNKTVPNIGDFSLGRVNDTTFSGSVISPCACRNGCPPSIITYIIFGVVVLVALILLFCIVGMVYKRCKGARGWEMIPLCGCKKKGYTEIN